MGAAALHCTLSPLCKEKLLLLHSSAGTTTIRAEPHPPQAPFSLSFFSHTGELQHSRGKKGKRKVLDPSPPPPMSLPYCNANFEILIFFSVQSCSTRLMVPWTHKPGCAGLWILAKVSNKNNLTGLLSYTFIGELNPVVNLLNFLPPSPTGLIMLL